MNQFKMNSMHLIPENHFNSYTQGSIKLSTYGGMCSLIQYLQRYVHSLVGLMMLLILSNVSAQINYDARGIEFKQNKYNLAAERRVESWVDLIRSARYAPEKEKLAQVNDFFNRQIKFSSDRDIWLTQDYWASPLEVLVKGAGDCEDYSFAKYFTLKALGVAEDKMRITYVKSLKINKAHMVLTYFSTSDSVVVLDNLVSAIKPANERTDLFPVYSVSGANLWLAKNRTNGKKLDKGMYLNLVMD